VMVTYIGRLQNIEGASLMYTLIIKLCIPTFPGLVVRTVRTFPTKVMILDGPEVISKPILQAPIGHR
jgi:hypothetical protein